MVCLNRNPAILTVSALFIALAAFASTATAEPSLPDGIDLPAEQESFEYCGDVKPVFKNPDLQPEDDGYVHASGWFFIQFQVIEAEETDVDRLSFSFGKPIPEQARTCDTPEWITDAYYKDYRVDDDPEDGFFIPINTTNVPDGEYAAAVSVYNEDGDEVGRMFTRAIVENGCPVGWRGADCDQDTVRENDVVKPWPIVLPGDGQQANDVDGLTVEFAEAIQAVHAEIAPSPDAPSEVIELEEMEPRAWDEDSIFAPADEDAPACPACADNAWGAAYKWEGDIGEDAVVTVEAIDQAGNQATKILHMGSTAAGGVIDVQLPEIEVTMHDAKLTAGPGEEVGFEATLQNVGKDTAHVDLLANDTGPLDASWEPNHVAVDSGAEAPVTLQASSEEPGEHAIEAHVSYKQGAEDVREPLTFTLDVEGQASEEDPDADEEDEPLEQAEQEDTDDSEAGSELPFLAPALAVGVLVAVAVAGRGR